MDSKLQAMLLAFGFTVAGSAGTVVGYTLANRQAVATPTATGTSGPGDTAAAPPGPLQGAPRAKATRRARAAARGVNRGQRSLSGATASSRGPGTGRSWGTLAEDLDLDTEQRREWLQMVADIRSNCATARQAQTDTTLELLVAAVSAEDPASEALHAQVEEQLEARREAAHCMLNEVIEFQATLTPEQRSAIAERVEKLEARREAWLDAWSQ